MHATLIYTQGIAPAGSLVLIGLRLIKGKGNVVRPSLDDPNFGQPTEQAMGTRTLPRHGLQGNPEAVERGADKAPGNEIAVHLVNIQAAVRLVAAFIDVVLTPLLDDPPQGVEHVLFGDVDHSLSSG